MYPDLTDKFVECVPDFASLSAADQKSLTKMFWRCVSSSPKFIENSYSAHISGKQIKAMWGTVAQMNFVVSYKFFSCLQGDGVSKKTSSFTPCIEMLQAYECSVKSKAVTPLRMASGTPFIYRSHAAVVASKTSQNTRRHGTGQPAAFLPINSEGLTTHLASPICKRCKQATLKLLCLSNSQLDSRGIPMRYQERPFGRIFDEQGIQGMPRAVRNIALQGCFDYDISNCHLAILSIFAPSLLLNIPTINHYIANKQKIRSSISRSISASSGIEVSEDDVKKAIISLVYGAHLSSSEFVGLVEILESKKTREAFIKEPFITQLNKELKNCREAIVEKNLSKGGWITNALGIKKQFLKDAKLSASDYKSALSFLLTGIEAKALDSVLKRWGDKVVLCIHDGWVMKEDVSVLDFEDVILKATGFALKVERSQLMGNKSPCKHRSAPNQETEKTYIDQEDRWIFNQIEKTKGPRACNGPTSGVLCIAAVPSWGVFPTGSFVLSGKPLWNLHPEYRGGYAKGGRRRRNGAVVIAGQTG